jgi:chromosome segregation ATPase
VKRARLQAALALATLSFGSILGSSKPALAAGPDSAAEAQRLVTLLDTPATRTVVADPLAKAKAAQQRAQSARGAGDLHHATELDALALTWAQVADDLVRTASAEKKLSDLQKQVADLEQKAVRTQALIEQTIARRGRAEQNLNSAETAKPAAKAAASKTVGNAASTATATKEPAASNASKPGSKK